MRASVQEKQMQSVNSDIKRLDPAASASLAFDGDWIIRCQDDAQRSQGESSWAA